MEPGTERPMFIPPRKRQSGRKGAGSISHVDHIMTVQGRIPTELPSPRHLTAPTSPLGDLRGNPAQIMAKDRPKMELPTIIDDEIYTTPVNADTIEEDIDIKTAYQLGLNKSREIIDLSPIYENAFESNELTSFENLTLVHTKLEDHQESSTVTPNSLSQTQSDNSIDTDIHDQNSSRSKKSKKRVNIQMEPSSQDDIYEPSEHVALRQDSETSGSLDRSMMSGSTEGYLTMTGTIKRGKKKGQCVDVQLNISREELEILEATIVAKELNKQRTCCICNLRTGLHILFWSLVCMPFVTIISSIYSFYMGTITWYNMFTYFSEEKSYLHKIFISPILVILYPFVIVICTFGLGIYAGLIQLSMCGSTWWKEVWDVEKGFYGWLCAFLRLSDCSPYEVVILTDLRGANIAQCHVQSSTEEISM